VGPFPSNRICANRKRLIALDREQLNDGSRPRDQVGRMEVVLIATFLYDCGKGLAGIASREKELIFAESANILLSGSATRTVNSHERPAKAHFLEGRSKRSQNPSDSMADEAV